MIDPFDWNGNGKPDDFDHFMDFVVFNEMFKNGQKCDEDQSGDEFDSENDD